jgi:UDP-glucose 4-epimerase
MNDSKNPSTNSPLTQWASLHGTHFQGKKALVTGGAGFIGSHLAGALSALGAKVTVIDDLIGTGGSWENVINLPIDRVQASILDSAVLAKAAAGADYVFHLAALGSVPGSVADPVGYQNVNVNGTLAVLEAARKSGVKRVMFAASSAAYGDSEVLPKIESMPVLPKSPYAANKVAGEALMRAYAGSYGLDTASLRYFNIFGPNQNANSAYAAVIAAFAKAILSGQPPVIFGDGEQSRDFTYVDNAVHANLLAARHPTPIGGEVLNVATAKRITVNELAREMLDLMGRTDLSITRREERAGDVKHSLADISKTAETIGFKPIVDFKKGLAATIEWYKANAK